MEKTSSTRRNPSKARPRRARKNPFGLLDEGFLKDGLMPLGIGFVSGHINRPEAATTFAFWHKLDVKMKVLALVFAATWFRRKGNARAEGAALAIAGQHIEQWMQQRKLKAPADSAAPPKEIPSDAKGLAALAHYEMEELGSLYEHANNDIDEEGEEEDLARDYDFDFSEAS